MIDLMFTWFVQYFQNPTAWGIGLAIAFGAVWLTPYRPPLFKKPWLWAVLVISAFLTLASICFIQVPLQDLAYKALSHFWSLDVLLRWIRLTVMPLILLTGLVQEGAKLVLVVDYWWRHDKTIDPKLGLAIGAVAGAGFGILEAQFNLNDQFGPSGWTWQALQLGGLSVLLGFLEIFFTVAAHIAFSALAGYGLAKGWGWQFYLIAAALHALLDYRGVLLPAGLPASVYEIYAVLLAALVTAGALWLRWRRTPVTASPTISAE